MAKKKRGTTKQKNKTPFQKRMVVFFEDRKGPKPVRPVRLYVTVSTKPDTEMLAEYISHYSPKKPFVFESFGASGTGYTASNLQRDLRGANIKLMKSDLLGTTNQDQRTIVYRKIRDASGSYIALRINNGALFKL